MSNGTSEAAPHGNAAGACAGESGCPLLPPSSLESPRRRSQWFWCLFGWVGQRPRPSPPSVLHRAGSAPLLSALVTRLGSPNEKKVKVTWSVPKHSPPLNLIGGPVPPHRASKTWILTPGPPQPLVPSPNLPSPVSPPRQIAPAEEAHFTLLIASLFPTPPAHRCVLPPSTSFLPPASLPFSSLSSLFKQSHSTRPLRTEGQTRSSARDKRPLRASRAKILLRRGPSPDRVPSTASAITERAETLSFSILDNRFIFYFLHAYHHNVARQGPARAPQSSAD